MRYLRWISSTFAPGDARIESVLAALDARLPSRIGYVFRGFAPRAMADRTATISTWLESGRARTPRAQVLASVDGGALLTLVNRQGRDNGERIGEITLQLREDLAPVLEDVLEAGCDAARAAWGQGFHGADRYALGLLEREIVGRAGDVRVGWVGYFAAPHDRKPALPGQVRRSRAGLGWVYRLTPDPIDLGLPDHAAKARAAIAALPRG
jgi:hypothetical protein